LLVWRTRAVPAASIWPLTLKLSGREPALLEFDGAISAICSWPCGSTVPRIL
jgi:hypothetical protein